MSQTFTSSCTRPISYASMRYASGVSIGVTTMANKKALFVMLVVVSFNSKHTEAIFSPNLTDSLCQLVDQVPKSRDIANFCAHDDNTTAGAPCACEWVIVIYQYMGFHMYM